MSPLSWLDLVDNPQPVVSTFGKEVPSLSGINLLSVSLDRRLRRAHLGFETPSFPTEPPKKWIGSNTVQLTLSFSQITSFHMSGWTDQQKGRLEISGLRPLIDVGFENGDYGIQFRAESFRVEYLAAYIMEKE